MVERLDCRVMPYAWGSRTAIAELTGRAKPTAPEAELWMGAHPTAASRVGLGIEAPTLDAVIDADPAATLGDQVRRDLGPRLPFLLKVLAAAEPLSLQAHPTADQARNGFADEDRRGIPRDAPTRNYRDSSHKPELVCALTPFEALCGFRRANETLALMERLRVPELEPALAHVRGSSNSLGLAGAFRTLMTMPAADRPRLVEGVRDACARLGSDDVSVVPRLAALYPDDVGVVCALLLNHVRLAPGEAIYLGAGNLHAYLGGVAVEIMASSDNVLRGGLTKKHVDVPELMRVLDFSDGPVVPQRPRAVDAHESVYDTPAREFRLATIRVPPSNPAEAPPVTRHVVGPEILLCTEGSVVVHPADGTPSVELPRGGSAFVPFATGSYTLRGAGLVWRATTNLEPTARSL